MSKFRTTGAALAAAICTASSVSLAANYTDPNYMPWNYSAGCVVWRATEANFHASTIADVLPDGTVDNTPYQLGTSGHPWQVFASTLNGGSNPNYTVPGLVLVYDKQGYAASTDASFSPLSLGGLWVRTNAAETVESDPPVTYSLGGTSSNARVTELGADGYSAFFKIDKSFSINRSGQTQIKGSALVEVAVNEVFQTSGSGVATVLGETATLKLGGLGSIYAGGGLIVNGTLDLSNSGDDPIKGPVTINSTATIKIPSGAQIPGDIRISDTQILAAPTANIEHNGTLYENAKIEPHLNGSSATLYITPTTKCTATLTGDTAFANIVWDGGIAPNNMNESVIVLSGHGRVTGLTQLPVRLEIDNNVEVDMSDVTDFSNTTLVGTGTFVWTKNYPEDVPAGFVYAFYGGPGTSPSEVTSVSVAGTLKVYDTVYFKDYASAGTASVLDVWGTAQLDCGDQALHGVININAGATFQNLRTADAIAYSTYDTTVNVKGMLEMGATRWSLNRTTLNVYAGGTIRGSGQHENGALDFFDGGKLHAYDDLDVEASIRFRNELTQVIVESGKTLTLTATKRGYDSGGITKKGAGLLRFIENPAVPGGILVLEGTIVFDTPNDVDITSSVYYEVQPFNCSFLTAPNWKGTLHLPALVSSSGGLQVPLQNYGTENSSIVMDGLSTSGNGTTYLGRNNIEVKSALVLDGDVKFNNGYSGQTITFSKLAGGAGNLEFAVWTGCTGVTYAFNEIDANSYSGQITLTDTLSNMTFKVGNIVKSDTNPGTKVLSIANETMATIDLSAATLNGVSGLLELRADGIYISDSAHTISGIGATVVTAPADANPDDVCRMVQIVPPTPEAQVAVGNAGADYRSYFRMSATYDAGTGTWTVTAELDVDRVLPGGTAVLESVLTSSSDMTIQVCPGLYYAIGVSETLSDLQRPASTLATTTTLTKEKPMGARSAFFRVYVSVTPFAAE